VLHNPAEDGPPAPRGDIISASSGVLDDMRRVLVERGATYADIADNSRVFSALMLSLGVRPPDHMTPTQFHCLANICTKLARVTTGDWLHEDSYLDIANYAVLILADIRRNRRSKGGTL
jgi:hypothetical protein